MNTSILFLLVSSCFLSLFNLLIIILRFVCHLIFIFIVYTESYSLLIKSGFWDKIENSIIKINHPQWGAAVTKIKKTNKYFNPVILVLETYI